MLGVLGSHLIARSQDDTATHSRQFTRAGPVADRYDLSTLGRHASVHTRVAGADADHVTASGSDR